MPEIKLPHMCKFNGAFYFKNGTVSFVKQIVGLELISFLIQLNHHRQAEPSVAGKIPGFYPSPVQYSN